MVNDSPGMAMTCPGDTDPEPTSTLAHRVTRERFQPPLGPFVYKKGFPRAPLTLLAKVVQAPGHGGQRYLLGRGRSEVQTLRPSSQPARPSCEAPSPTSHRLTLGPSTPDWNGAESEGFSLAILAPSSAGASSLEPKPSSA